ncbi:MAG: hypothetical protein RR701_07815 [Comamonas sp.]
MTKNIAPDAVAQALSMRAAGYTVTAISQELGIGVRTLGRHFAKHGSSKGSAMPEVIEASRSKLLALITSDDAIRQQAAQLLHDDLAHVQAVREAMAVMLETIREKPPTTPKDAALTMRAIVAYSTALKNTADVWRHSLRMDERTADDKPMPELHIHELTAEQIENLKTREFNPYAEEEVGTVLEMSES